MKDWALYSSVGALVGAVLFFAFALFMPEMMPTGQRGQVVERTLPVVSLNPVNENYSALHTKSLKKEVQIVNFFASWCAPCLAEHPYLIEIEKELSVPIHGIAFKDQAVRTDRYLKDHGNPYQTVSQDSHHIAAEFGVRGLPETFVIDADGMIRYHHRGPILKQEMDLIFVPLIQELRVSSSQ